MRRGEARGALPPTRIDTTAIGAALRAQLIAAGTLAPARSGGLTRARADGPRLVLDAVGAKVAADTVARELARNTRRVAAGEGGTPRDGTADRC